MMEGGLRVGIIRCLSWRLEGALVELGALPGRRVQPAAERLAGSSEPDEGLDDQARVVEAMRDVVACARARGATEDELRALHCAVFALRRYPLVVVRLDAARNFIRIAVDLERDLTANMDPSMRRYNVLYLEDKYGGLTEAHNKAREKFDNLRGLLGLVQGTPRAPDKDIGLAAEALARELDACVQVSRHAFEKY